MRRPMLKKKAANRHRAAMKHIQLAMRALKREKLIRKRINRRAKRA